ncbi:hypothetical protein [Dyella japonica]|uniref:Pilus formation protein N-terminal domain-containing protein n=1 Tax=Dyella japonica A8 TaxID=1217721 RepID=A0A075JWV5_9GAMM|nr:hypothetical protein [Dyella japonica]AIF45962.1 hypothetical protein HY57_01110 [Dyella japonica A8]
MKVFKRLCLLAALFLPMSVLGGGLDLLGGVKVEDPHDNLERIRASRHLVTMAVMKNDRAHAVDIPTELVPFMSATEIPVYINKADLEETGRQDYVLVVGAEDSEDKILRVISRDASGTLKLVLSRSDVLMCDGCGGMDEGSSIGLGKGTIEIRNIQGSASGGIDVTCLFRYSKTSRLWLLVDQATFLWSTDVPQGESQTSVQHKTAKDFGAVSLAGPKLFEHCF